MKTHMETITFPRVVTCTCNYMQLVVLLCVPLSQLRAWMTAVYDAGMATGDYAFIYVDPDLQTPTAQAQLTSQSLWQQNSVNDSKVKQAMQSVLIVRTFKMCFVH